MGFLLWDEILYCMYSWTCWPIGSWQRWVPVHAKACHEKWCSISNSDLAGSNLPSKLPCAYASHFQDLICWAHDCSSALSSPPSSQTGRRTTHWLPESKRGIQFKCLVLSNRLWGGPTGANQERQHLSLSVDSASRRVLLPNHNWHLISNHWGWRPLCTVEELVEPSSIGPYSYAPSTPIHSCHVRGKSGGKERWCPLPIPSFSIVKIGTSTISSGTCHF